MSQLAHCPRCRAAQPAPQTAGRRPRLVCPQCGLEFFFSPRKSRQELAPVATPWQAPGSGEAASQKEPTEPVAPASCSPEHPLSVPVAQGICPPSQKATAPGTGPLPGVRLFRWAALAGLGLLVLGIGVLFFSSLLGPASEEERAQAPPTEEETATPAPGAQQEAETPAPASPASSSPVLASKSTSPPASPPAVEKKETPPSSRNKASPASASGAVNRPPAFSPQEQRIRQAIARGVDFLRRGQRPDGCFDGGPPIGATALAGLALLASGVPPQDPAVQRAATVIRTRAPQENQTYSIALAIFFLDKLANPQDEKLIRSLAVRLIAGQNEWGGWTYTCPLLTAPEEELLLTYLQQRYSHPLPPLITAEKNPPLSALTGRGKAPSVSELPFADKPKAPAAPPDLAVPDRKQGNSKPERKKEEYLLPLPDGAIRPAGVEAPEGKGRPASPGSPAVKSNPPQLTWEQLPASVRHLPVLRDPHGTSIEQNHLVRPGGDDNSNSQFAMLALWIARRHGVPVTPALARLEPRYRRTQHEDGGWSYHSVFWPKKKNTFPKQLTKHLEQRWDTASRPAMTCVGLLGLAMGHGIRSASGTPPSAPRPDAPADGKPVQDLAIQRGLDRLAAWIGHPTRNPGAPLTMDLYSLWSVERVAVLYNRKTIGGKDWYAWAAEMLLAQQHADGSWQGPPYPGSCPPIDTCFALLILQRTNLAPDLSAELDRLLLIERREAPSPGQSKRSTP
jgi:hypothetical protein